MQTIDISLRRPKLNLELDVKVFLVAIPLISAFNYYLTYPNIQFDNHLLLTYSIDTIQGFVAWYGVRKLIQRFDQRLPYQSGMIKRTVIQLIATTLLGLGIIIVLTELTSWVALGRSAISSFYTLDILIIAIWFLVINGFYIGWHFYKELNDQNQSALFENKTVFFSAVGKKVSKVNAENISYFTIAHDRVLAIDKQNQKHTIDLSLNEVESKLPKKLFFRLNRQWIAHRDAIKGFSKEVNGKLSIQIGTTEKPVIMSRTKAPAFKTWFKG